MRGFFMIPNRLTGCQVSVMGRWKSSGAILRPPFMQQS
jgi:hypothetical protein